MALPPAATATLGDANETVACPAAVDVGVYASPMTLSAGACEGVKTSSLAPRLVKVSVRVKLVTPWLSPSESVEGATRTTFRAASTMRTRPAPGRLRRQRRVRHPELPATRPGLCA